MSITWSWTLKSGDGDSVLVLRSGPELKAAVTGAMLALGTGADEAREAARSALEAAWQQQGQRTWNVTTKPWTWNLELPDGKALSIVSDDRPEDPEKYCDGRNEAGNRCSRHLNHLGEC